jgi:uncharacterized membrane protein YphA (DoxX/SURF4 family)
MNNPISQRLITAKRVARVALGFVWIYEGLVPKVLFGALHPEQTDLVFRSGLYWSSPTATLFLMGLLQAALGVILVIGWRERGAVAAATGWMIVLIYLVAHGRPDLMTDPFGALAKDACLIACAAVVWILAEIPIDERIGKEFATPRVKQ